MRDRIILISCLCLTMAGLGSCNRQFSVSINNQPVFTPNAGAAAGQVQDANLQGCINLALRQLAQADPEQLLSLSCANSEVETVAGLDNYSRLRFLDLADNQISDLSPLAALGQLSGLNLPGNRLADIATLLQMPALKAVNLAGNPAISCSQLDMLQDGLGAGLTRPVTCRN